MEIAQLKKWKGLSGLPVDGANIVRIRGSLRGILINIFDHRSIYGTSGCWKNESAFL
jgi:hypothetical protein